MEKRGFDVLPCPAGEVPLKGAEGAWQRCKPPSSLRDTPPVNRGRHHLPISHLRHSRESGNPEPRNAEPCHLLGPRLRGDDEAERGSASPPQAGEDTLLPSLHELSDGLEQLMKAEGAVIAPDRPEGKEDRKMVGATRFELVTPTMST